MQFVDMGLDDWKEFGEDGRAMKVAGPLALSRLLCGLVEVGNDVLIRRCRRICSLLNSNFIRLYLDV
jgi:hypothetical protein